MKTMTGRRGLAVFLVLCLVMNAACVPASYLRPRRGLSDNKVDSKESKDDKGTSVDKDSDDDDFEAEFNKSPPPPAGGGGSNIFSLLNLASALFPASSSSGGLSGGTSSSSQSSSTPKPSPVWTLKMDILRAVLQFGTSMLGIASTAFGNASV